jgi:hypothetical protein
VNFIRQSADVHEGAARVGVQRRDVARERAGRGL